MWAYAIGVRFWEWLIRQASAWHQGAAGRHKMLLEPWPQNAENLNPIWFHCASLGEYEQILPVIQCWEARHPNHQILVSFYSASGFNIVKPSEQNRWVVGFPGDLKPELIRFLSHFKPQLAVFTKAEIWPLCLSLLSQNQIPAMLVAFRPGRSKNLALKPGRFLVKHMQKLACISCQDEQAQTFLTELGLKNVFTDGDPRVERTLALQNFALDWPQHIRWIQEQPMLVLGSVWPADLDLWEPILNSMPKVNWVIAPHQWTTKFKQRIEKKFPNAQFWSKPNIAEASNIVVVDTVGVLSRLYKQATAAYVGGGFGRGIHSVLEPAAAGIPVSFGPKHSQSREALAFIEIKAGKALMNRKDAQAWIEELSNDSIRHQTQKKLSAWFKQQAGAQQKIVERMEGVLNQNGGALPH